MGIVTEEKFNNSSCPEKDYYWLRKTEFAGSGEVESLHDCPHFILFPRHPEKERSQKGFSVRYTLILSWYDCSNTFISMYTKKKVENFSLLSTNYHVYFQKIHQNPRCPVCTKYTMLNMGKGHVLSGRCYFKLLVAYRLSNEILKTNKKLYLS